MNKMFRAPVGDKKMKSRISLWIPKKMKQEINQLLAKKGISSKKQSFWISNTVVNLAKRSDHLDCIIEEWLEPGISELIYVTLDMQAIEALDQLSNTLTVANMAEDNQSSIIRTAITQALITEDYGPFNYI